MKVQRIQKIIIFILTAFILVSSLFTGTLYAEQSDTYDHELAPYGSVLTRDLSSGMTGSDVAALQSMLYTLGYMKEDVSGCFDQKTETAVIAFQTDNNLTDPQGVVNRDTREALNNALSGLSESTFFLIYDIVLTVGSSSTITPVFYDGQEHSVILYCNSPIINIYGMTITALYPGTTEVTAECEGHIFKFFVCVRTEELITERSGALVNANNVNKGFSRRLEELESYSGDMSSTIMFAGDCYLDERLFLTDLYESRYPDNNVFSISLSGTTSKQWQTFIPYIYQYQPSSLVMCIGMNDLRHGSTVKATIGNLIKLLEAIRENIPDTTVYWWNIMPHIGSPEQYYKIAAVNAYIKDYFSEDSKLIVVDSNAAMSDENGIADSSLFIDALHPNSKGYDNLFQAAEEAGLKLTK